MVGHTKVRDGLAVDYKSVRFTAEHERRCLQTLLYDCICFVEELLDMNDTLTINFIRRDFVLDNQWTRAAYSLETYMGVIEVGSCRSMGNWSS